MNEFNGKTVLISGATRGLGRSLASAFFQHEATLFLIARSEMDLIALKCELQSSENSKQQEIHIIPGDLSAPNAVEKIMQYINEAKCEVDVLINNAAIQGPIGRVWENNWHDWQQTLYIDLIAPIALMRACIPTMIKKNHGKIINLSGGGATSPRPNFSAYATAKSALVRFSETLAEEVKQYHIDVNCIAPGIMNTDLLTEVIKAGVDLAGAREIAIAQNKIHEKDTTKQAAELCLYLASSQSDGITGKLISAVWDPWKKFADYKKELTETDIYTIRRIIPKERNMAWGDVE